MEHIFVVVGLCKTPGGQAQGGGSFIPLAFLTEHEATRFCLDKSGDSEFYGYVKVPIGSYPKKRQKKEARRK